jgi:hypothetical protein
MTVGNNLLYDATLTPNLRLGFRLSDHWSMGLTAGYRPWPTDDDTNTKWRHLLLSPDVRYWFDGVNTGHFVGGNLIYAHYNMANVDPIIYNIDKSVRRQGDLGAIGAFYGYSWNLGRYWNLEAVIGAAIGYTKYGRYECGHCGRKLSTEKKLFAMPQAALNIVYNIPGRPKPAPVVEEPVILPPQQTHRTSSPSTKGRSDNPLSTPGGSSDANRENEINGSMDMSVDNEETQRMKWRR